MTRAATREPTPAVLATRAAILARLGAAWTSVRDLERAGAVGVAGFPRTGTLAVLVRSGAVEAERRRGWGKGWMVRLPRPVSEETARGAAGDVVDLPEPGPPRRWRLCPAHGEPAVYKGGRCGRCPREVSPC